MPFVFLAFVLVPIAEIAVFIEVGGMIGLWPTIGIVILTALLGTSLLRAQGLAAFGRAQAAMSEGRLPVEEVVHGFCLVIAGALLLTPGFLTDIAGFLLFVHPVRLMLARAAMKWFAKNGTVHVHANAGFAQNSAERDPSARSPDTTIVEGQAEEVDAPPPAADNDDAPNDGTPAGPPSGSGRWIPPKDS
ncbi:FxsA family protein [Parvibaculaceae bacterium PLY_AMNH_Bact1]|nr:FxsA family protein [Parvibaculaceae bacterium PLY_AMNH_Bact1]